jgi:hypothetical protein
MKVLVVTESFAPSVNGVARSVTTVVRKLSRRGHRVTIVAPGPGPEVFEGLRVVRVQSVRLPGLRQFPVGLPTRTVEDAVETVRPDVVHLASPFVLGGAAASAAVRLGIPVVAVYQTDVAGFASQYRLGAAGRAAWRRLRVVHARADVTLAPSTSAVEDLAQRRAERGAELARHLGAGRLEPEPGREPLAGADAGGAPRRVARRRRPERRRAPVDGDAVRRPAHEQPVDPVRQPAAVAGRDQPGVPRQRRLVGVDVQPSAGADHDGVEGERRGPGDGAATGVDGHRDPRRGRVDDAAVGGLEHAARERQPQAATGHVPRLGDVDRGRGDPRHRAAGRGRCREREDHPRDGDREGREDERAGTEPHEDLTRDGAMGRRPSRRGEVRTGALGPLTGRSRTAHAVGGSGRSYPRGPDAFRSGPGRVRTGRDACDGGR